MYLKLIILSVFIVGIALAGIAIKMFVQKNGEFKKHCSSSLDAHGKKIGCACSSGLVKPSCEHKHSLIKDI